MLQIFGSCELVQIAMPLVKGIFLGCHLEYLYIWMCRLLIDLVECKRNFNSGMMKWCVHGVGMVLFLLLDVYKLCLNMNI